MKVAVLGTGRMAAIHLAAARRAGVHHGLIQNMRFNPGPRKAKELLEQGMVGGVFSVDVLFGYMVPRRVTSRPTWFYKKEEAGGGLVEDMMAHFFDLLRHLIGPIEGVYAATGIAWDTRFEPDGTPFSVEVEDLASVSIRFENGAIGNWEDAVINQRLIKAAYRSAAERREVRLAEVSGPVGAPA